MMRRLGALVMMGIVSTACMSTYPDPEEVIAGCNYALWDIEQYDRHYLREQRCCVDGLYTASGACCAISITSTSPVTCVLACCWASILCVKGIRYDIDLQQGEDKVSRREKELHAKIAEEQRKIKSLSSSESSKKRR